WRRYTAASRSAIPRSRSSRPVYPRSGCHRAAGRAVVLPNYRSLPARLVRSNVIVGASTAIDVVLGIIHRLRRLLLIGRQYILRMLAIDRHGVVDQLAQARATPD